MQSLCALGHYVFNDAGAYSYEQAHHVARRLSLPMASHEELFRRMVFNVLARNQDDHTKNITFLMDRAGQWSLSPAYDVTYAHNPDGPWTAQHQMSINGKRDRFTMADFETCSKTIGLKRGRHRVIFEEVRGMAWLRGGSRDDRKDGPANGRRFPARAPGLG